MSETQIPELGAVGLARFMWRQLTSMRTALTLLMLLGLASIPGSFIPQRTQNPMAVNARFESNRSLAIWMDRFSLFDVYGSPWFSAIYILLFISLIGCVLPRSIEHFHAMNAQPPKTPKNLARLEFYTELETPEALDKSLQWLKKHRFRIREHEGSISAEKGYLRETGNLLFHLSLILILIGVSVGALFGMKGEAIVNVGERFINTPTTYDSLTYGRLTDEGSLPPFIIRADKFVAKYNISTNAPEDYRLTVTAQDSPDAKPATKVVTVNGPLTFGNTRVYLQANGYSPLVTVRDRDGNIAFDGPVTFLPQDGNLRSIGAIKVPDMEPQIGFVGAFFPTFTRDAQGAGASSYPEALDPRLFISIWRGDLGLNTGVPQSVYRIDTSKMEKLGLASLKVGETKKFEDGSITFNGQVAWVNLQVVRDPGKSYALIGGILAIAGLLSSLFVRRRRIWVRVTGNSVQIAGLAKNAAPGLEDEIARLVKYLKHGE